MLAEATAEATMAEFDDYDPIDELAKPFLDIASKLDEARTAPIDHETWIALLETNSFLWRFASKHMPGQIGFELAPESEELVAQISEFMSKASMCLAEKRDEFLLDRVVEINLNMCDKLLGLRVAE